METEPTPSELALIALQKQNGELNKRLAEAEKTIAALQNGAKDTLVINTESGKQVTMLEIADRSYRELVETMNDGVITIAPDHSIIYCNKRFADILGVTPERIIGKIIDKYIYFFDLKLFQSVISKDYTEKNDVDIQLYSPSGKIIPVLFSCSPFINDTSATWLIFTELTDIKKLQAELKRANELLEEKVKIRTAELQESEEKANYLIKHAPTGIFEIDFSTRKFLSVNDAMVALSGYSREELLEMDANYILTEESRMDFSNRLSKMLQGEQPDDQIEYKVKKKDGSIIDVMLSVKFHVNEQGIPFGAMVVGHDITERRKAELALKESEERFHNMFKRHLVVELIIQPDTGKIIDANDAAVKFYGYSHADLCKMHVRDINQQTPEEIAKNLQMASSESRNKFEFPHRLANGEIHWVEVYSTPVEIGGKNLLYSIIHDITERKKAEEQIRNNQKTFTELVERAPFGIYIIDSDFCIAHMNSGSQNGAFINVRPLIGRKFTEAMHILWNDDVAEEIIANFRNTLETGEPFYSPRFTNPRNDVGIVESYEWELHRLLLPDGQFGVICYYYNSTLLRNAEDALRESEAKFRAAFDNGAIPMAISDTDSIFLKENPALCQMLGYTSDELTGHSFYEFTHPDDIPSNKIKAKSLYKEGEPFYMQKRYIRKDGKVVWADVHSAAVFNSKGKPEYVITHMQDITERKKVEEALIKNEKLLKSVIDNVSSGVALIDEDGKFSVFNPVFLKLFGLMEHSSIKNVNDQDWAKWTVYNETGQLLDVDDHPVRKAALTGKRVEQQLVGVRLPSGGDITWMLISAEPLVNAKGKIDKIICTYNDVTRLKLADEELKDSERKLRSVLDATQESIYMFDLQGNFILANAIGLKRLNVPSHEIIQGRHISEFMAAEYADIKMDKINEVILTGETVEFMDERKGKIFHHHYFPVFDAGQILYIVAYSRDITERVRFENELEEKNKQLQEINDTKDKFFSIIAHDMKNPFISMLGASEMLYENAGRYNTERIVTLSKILNDSATSGYNMLLNLLDWARSQAGSMAFSPQSLKLKEYIDKNLTNLLDIAFSKEIKLVFDVAPEVEVYADQNMLGTILRNLVNNALKFTPRGGEVRVGTLRKKKILMLFVKDNGIGIEKADLGKLFRTDIKHSSPGTEHEIGTGLGLLLCKEFVEKHCGQIWVESKRDKGTVFYFTLPYHVRLGKLSPAITEDDSMANSTLTLLPDIDVTKTLKEHGIKDATESEIDSLKRIHELEVYQIELELQSGQLMMEKLETEQHEERFIELLDHAPSGYIILNKKAEIFDLNLKASEMLGRERQFVKNGRMSFFISDETRSLFESFIQKIFKSNQTQTCRVILETGHKLPKRVYMTGIQSHNKDHCLVNIFDPEGFIPIEK